MDFWKTLNYSPCEPGSKRERISKVLEEFWEEAEETLVGLASFAFGNFLVTFLALMRQLAEKAAYNYITLVGTMLIGNVTSAFYSMVSTTLAMVNGFYSMTRYLAVKFLRAQLRDRISTSRALLIDLSNLLNILEIVDTYSPLNVETRKLNISAALPHVRRAKAIIAIEKQKSGANNFSFAYASRENTVSDIRLGEAIDEIDMAVQAISGETAVSPTTAASLNRLHQKYTGLKLPILDARIAHPGAIILYQYDIFKDTVGAIIESGSSIQSYSTYKKTKKKEGEKVLFAEWLAGLRKALPDNVRQNVLAYTLEFLNQPGISEFMRSTASTLLIKDLMDTLGLRIPIAAVATKNLYKNYLLNPETKSSPFIKNALSAGDSLRSALKSVFTFLGSMPSADRGVYKNSTISLGGVSAQVAAAQASIIMHEEWEGIVSFSSSIKGKFLTPAYNLLEGVESSMEDGQNPPQQNKRSEWVRDLTESRILISGALEQPTTFGTGQQATKETYEISFIRAKELYKELEEHIVSRVGDKDDKDPPQTEAQKIVQIANENLSRFALGELSIFNKAERKKVITTCQAIRINVEKMLADDLIELNLCNQYITEMENNPFFNSILKPAWDNFITSLESVPIASEAVEYLKEGNLADIVNAVTTGTTVATSGLSALKNCEGENPDLLNKAEIPQAKKIEGRIVQETTALNNTWAMIQAATDKNFGGIA